MTCMTIDAFCLKSEPVRRFKKSHASVLPSAPQSKFLAIILLSNENADGEGYLFADRAI